MYFILLNFTHQIICYFKKTWVNFSSSLFIQMVNFITHFSLLHFVPCFQSLKKSSSLTPVSYAYIIIFVFYDYFFSSRCPYLSVLGLLRRMRANRFSNFRTRQIFLNLKLKIVLMLMLMFMRTSSLFHLFHSLRLSTVSFSVAALLFYFSKFGLFISD